MKKKEKAKGIYCPQCGKLMAIIKDDKKKNNGVIRCGNCGFSMGNPG